VNSQGPSTVRKVLAEAAWQGIGIDPVRIVLDTRLSMPADAKMLTQSSPAPTYVVCAAEAEDDKKERLTRAGARIMEAPLQAGRIDLNALMDRLGELAITSLLIEGGALVADSAIKADIVDKAAFFYAPKILGGDDGRPMFGGTGPQWMKDALHLDAVTVDRFGEDIRIQGYFKRTGV